MKNKSWNKLFLELVSDKPVAFSPSLARIARSATAGLFMSQLLYWWNKGEKKDWIYKTIEEFERETCLTRSEQERAIAIWSELGVIEKRLFGIPAKRHFHIDTDRLFRLAEATTKFAEISKQDCRIEPSNTENTPENTSEISRIYNTGRVSDTRSENYKNI